MTSETWGGHGCKTNSWFGSSTASFGSEVVVCETSSLECIMLGGINTRCNSVMTYAEICPNRGRFRRFVNLLLWRRL